MVSRCQLNKGFIKAACLKWDEAAQGASECIRAFHSHVLDQLVTLPFSEQQAYLQEAPLIAYHGILSMCVANPRSRVVRELAATTSLNMKGLAHEAMGRMSQVKVNKKAQISLGRLALIRTEISELAINGATGLGEKKRLRELQVEERELIKRVSVFSDPESRFLQVDDVYKGLSENEIFIDFTRVKEFDFQAKSLSSMFPRDRYCAWVYQSNDEDGPLFIDLGDAKAADKLMQRYVEAVRKYGSGSVDSKQGSKDLYGISRLLEERILDPVLKRVNKIDSGENLHLVISPDSTLWMLPWAALHTREQAFLVEDFVVRTVVSGRDLCRSDSMPELAANNSSVVFSNPDFDEKVVVDKQVTSK